MSEIMTWVGDDASRAQAAYDAELVRDDAAYGPRKTLLDKLIAAGAVP